MKVSRSAMLAAAAAVVLSASACTSVEGGSGASSNSSSSRPLGASSVRSERAPGGDDVGTTDECSWPDSLAPDSCHGEDGSRGPRDVERRRLRYDESPSDDMSSSAHTRRTAAP